ncbi:hypothetical protein I8J29_12835 [Paenibacillus sp. MWE-103]|uniref:Uncharacterized protein n=1 Tax=Paenibacillus artemisiicola TaxID=1172618 RepID=A0ABS3W9X9_9BACL|nr:hypothetical protein [Paenibacillus artemisiicola]MBO7745088.1 hypothetical protein [Paenibacillus artemisiicola]
MIKKKRYAIWAVLFLGVAMALTKPSDEDYHAYLYRFHGVCANFHDPCVHSISEHVRTLPFYMTAETNISDDKEIRVFGMFHHFFIRKNTLGS